MRRVLFSARGVPIWSYPTLLYVGLVCGFYVMYAVAPSVGMQRVSAAIATLIMFVPAIVGARIWFVLDHWAIYRHDLRRIWRHSDGGMTLYGGLVLTLVLSPVILAPLGLRFAAFWDGATFTILVGMIFTRFGCLLNGCCSGRRSDGRLGLWLPDHTGRWERRYPVQLLELAAALVLLRRIGSATRGRYAARNDLRFRTRWATPLPVSHRPAARTTDRCQCRASGGARGIPGLLGAGFCTRLAGDGWMTRKPLL